jgi:hypothetical protein
MAILKGEATNLINHGKTTTRADRPPKATITRMEATLAEVEEVTVDVGVADTTSPPEKTAANNNAEIE